MSYDVIFLDYGVNKCGLFRSSSVGNESPSRVGRAGGRLPGIENRGKEGGIKKPGILKMEEISFWDRGGCCIVHDYLINPKS